MQTKSAAARVLELQPGYTISGTCAAFDIHPSVAVPLSEALAAGLPASIVTACASFGAVATFVAASSNSCHHIQNPAAG